MTTLEIGKQLVELCRSGKNDECQEKLYSPEIVSVEAGAPPGKSPESKGIEAIRAKSKWWAENHEIHKAEVEGPFPHGDRFAVVFKYDITFKPENKRFPMHEVALYTVKDDKITREEFFYSM
jgi:hypothetical protein